MNARLLLVGVCTLAVVLLRDPAAADESPARDIRLTKVTTLDDYHPWTPITEPAVWRARAARVREQILVSAGLWPMPPRPPIHAVIHGAIDRGDYTVEKVFFESYPGFYVTGNLYRPKGSSSTPRPAVLCPHGHWQNGRLYERPDDQAKAEMERGAEKTLNGAKYPLQARCAQLVRMGCVVFFYDMVGNADSQQLGHAQGFRDIESELRLQSAFGLQTFNSIRAFDFLSSLDGVDSKRIAVTGASGGGTQTFILCAIDDRPAVAFPAVMVSTAMQGGCVCENATLLRVGTGNIELAALTAPRPLGMTGANDWTIDIERKGLPELKALYASLGAPDNVYAKCYPNFDHNYNQVSREEMYRWVNRHLKLGFPEPVAEKPFEPILPNELRVFDDTHKLPADAVDAAGLKKMLTEISTRQLAELQPRDAASLKTFQDLVWRALRAIVSDELPGANDVAAVEEEKLAKEKDGLKYSATKLTLSRRGSGEAVPALWLEPASWSGTVVLLLGKDGLATVERTEAAAPDLKNELLKAGAALIGVDLFLTGGQVPQSGLGSVPVDAQRHKDFCGYTYGYNRTPLANQVHDALTALGHARSRTGVKRVILVGAPKMGHVALLASAIAGDAVLRTVTAAPHFDFAEVKDLNDLRFLPGGAKYGGWGGFAALYAPRELSILKEKFRDADQELPKILRDAYRAAHSEEKLKVLTLKSDAEISVEVLR